MIYLSETLCKSPEIPLLVWTKPIIIVRISVNIFKYSNQSSFNPKRCYSCYWITRSKYISIGNSWWKPHHRRKAPRYLWYECTMYIVYISIFVFILSAYPRRGSCHLTRSLVKPMDIIWMRRDMVAKQKYWTIERIIPFKSTKKK